MVIKLLDKYKFEEIEEAKKRLEFFNFDVTNENIILCLENKLFNSDSAVISTINKDELFSYFLSDTSVKLVGLIIYDKEYKVLYNYHKDSIVEKPTIKLISTNDSKSTICIDDKIEWTFEYSDENDNFLVNLSAVPTPDDKYVIVFVNIKSEDKKGRTFKMFFEY